MKLHLIFRTYIALARGEYLSASEISASVDIYDEYGECAESLPTVQFNWTEHGELKKEVCQARNLTEEQFDLKMIFPKPTEIQNLVYSSELRRIFGIENLRFIAEFNKDGIFILSKERGFFVPQIKNREIKTLKFYNWSFLKQRKAA